MKRSISVPENSVETLFGSYDENLKHFESTFNVRIRTQGHEILAEGDPPGPENVERVVNQLSSLSRDGYKVTTTDVKSESESRMEATYMATTLGAPPSSPRSDARGRHQDSVKR